MAPLYFPAFLFEEDCHNNVIVAIQSLGYEFTENHSSEKFTPTEVCNFVNEIWVIIMFRLTKVTVLNLPYEHLFWD